MGRRVQIGPSVGFVSHRGHLKGVYATASREGDTLAICATPTFPALSPAAYPTRPLPQRRPAMAATLWRGADHVYVYHGTAVARVVPALTGPSGRGCGPRDNRRVRCGLRDAIAHLCLSAATCHVLARMAANDGFREAMEG
jgi:hypothetical protein